MKSAKEKRNGYTANWHSSLAHYQGQLQVCATFLLPCGCGGNVIKEVEAEAIGVAIPDEFKLTFLLRTLAKTVIKHIGECTDGRRSRYTGSAFDLSTADESLPTYERIAYFLCKILKCQTRDASLLMGISDAQVETLFSMARRRIEEVEEVPRSERHLVTCSASVEMGLSIFGGVKQISTAMEGLRAAFGP